ncbi:MAG: D-aminoacyl-tRNA deacylase [Clostridia bacterium]
MRAVIQRVLSASVRVNNELVGQTEAGLLALIGVEVGDTERDLAYIAEKVPNLRIFEDDAGKMNRSLLDVGGGILAVSQFTLLGDARGGRRPSFITAARPDVAAPMVERLVENWRGLNILVGTGIFGADMKVSLVNDGPITILLDSRKLF